jgi:hypothetical protein
VRIRVEEENVVISDRDGVILEEKYVEFRRKVK